MSTPKEFLSSVREGTRVPAPGRAYIVLTSSTKEGVFLPEIIGPFDSTMAACEWMTTRPDGEYWLDGLRSSGDYQDGGYHGVVLVSTDFVTTSPEDYYDLHDDADEIAGYDSTRDLAR